ncbi:MAG: hypothetical protein KC483_02345 [Nitrosarchaeum sp.]|nr:hypothetical protein [Nitrosarchaeum sp.]
MSQIEAHYDQFQSSLKQIVKNVDVDLMMKIMYLERKLPDAPPHVELEIYLKQGQNPKRKEEALKSKYGFPTSLLGDHGVIAVGQMSMDMIAEISQDADIEHISGKATPASY